MERKNLYIDFDGVILDTMTPIFEEHKKYKFNNREEEKAFFMNYPWESIINDQHIIGNAIEDIYKIIYSNKFNLAILTHVNSIREATLKINYLRKYFEDITIIPCPKEIPKTKMIHTKDAILIDDYSGNLKTWKSEGGIPIRFSLKGNGKGYKTLKELKEVIEMF